MARAHRAKATRPGHTLPRPHGQGTPAKATRPGHTLPRPHGQGTPCQGHTAKAHRAMLNVDANNMCVPMEICTNVVDMGANVKMKKKMKKEMKMENEDKMNSIGVGQEDEIEVWASVKKKIVWVWASVKRMKKNVGAKAVKRMKKKKCVVVLQNGHINIMWCRSMGTSVDQNRK
ncbi:hypothetical protein FNV43_RR04230 [Rhamnella rubrinervis]|uniref:Uncharacterized protein n=1 Tax=Rhamnella rubrinervis TaxID=2594499 RepID=A0A8K0HKB0_9ROSA|nr:hypothetical protein FNV43_RR04230 [Rhamnella rubrinervis]